MIALVECPVLRHFGAFSTLIWMLACATPPPPPPPEPPPPAPLTAPKWFGDGKPQNSRPAPTTPAAERTVPLSNPGRQRPNINSSLGTNLAKVRYDSRAWVFTDVFRMASPWVSRSKTAWNDGQPLEQDDFGWVQSLLPGQTAATRFPSLNGGEFVVLHNGRGIFQFENAQVVAEKPGRIVIKAPPDQSVVLTITNVNSSDHIRDLHVVPLQFEGSFDKTPFHPAFMSRLSRFSVIRFTDWVRVPGSRIASWSKRSNRHGSTQASRRGVAYEHIIQLSNELWIEPWLSVPHLADDDYIRQLATLLRDNLDPALRVHVEYSHEVWRAPQSSRQAAYCATQGRFLGLGDGDPVKAQLAFAARRSLEVFRIFQHVLGSKRVVRVVSEAVFEPERRLSSQPGLQGNFDVLAVAAWVGAGLAVETSAKRLKKMSAEDITSDIAKNEISALNQGLTEVAGTARRLDVQLASYTGGMYLVAPASLRSNKRVNAALTKASRSPRMQVLQTALLKRWKIAGGALFVHGPLIASYGRKGRFGALETQDQALADAPRFRALLEFIDETPRWWPLNYTPPK